MKTEVKNPRLRQDLQISQVDESNYELADANTGATLRLDSIGTLLAEQFESGEGSLEEVEQRLQDQHDVRLRPGQILEFLQKCDSLGFLETPLIELRLGNISKGGERTLEFSASASLASAEEIRKLELESQHPYAFLFSIKRSTWIKVAAFIVFFMFPWKFRVGAPLAVEPYEKAVIRAASSGILEELFVREGDHVKKNQPLLRLKGLGLEIARKRSEIAKIEAELKRLEVGSTKEELDQMRKRLELARKIESQAEENAKSAKELYAKGLIPNQELQIAISDHEVKLKTLEQVEAELKVFEKGTRPEIIQAKKAERAGLEVDLKLLEELGERSLIRSPIDGVVATPDLPEMIGKQFNPGDLVMDIASPGHVTLRLQVRESDISHVEVGERLDFKVQALPNQTFLSRISRIAPLGEVNSETGEHIFRVYSDSENQTQKLLPGMTGVGQIDIGWRMLGTLILRKTIVAFRVNFVI